MGLEVDGAAACASWLSLSRREEISGNCDMICACKTRERLDANGYETQRRTFKERTK